MVPLRKKFCTSEARKPFFAAGSCSCYHLIVLRILCFGYGYSLHYTNERTNDYTARADFVKYLRLSWRNLCYMLLRKGGKVVERNTVCATILFHGYYYNPLSAKNHP